MIRGAESRLTAVEEGVFKYRHCSDRGGSWIHRANEKAEGKKMETGNLDERRKRKETGKISSTIGVNVETRTVAMRTRRNIPPPADFDSLSRHSYERWRTAVDSVPTKAVNTGDTDTRKRTADNITRHASNPHTPLLTVTPTGGARCTLAEAALY